MVQFQYSIDECFNTILYKDINTKFYKNPESAPSNVCDTGTIRKIVVGTCDTSGLHGAGEQGRVVEADHSYVVVNGGVIVLRVQDNLADIVHGAATMRSRAAENYTPLPNSVPTANNN